MRKARLLIFISCVFWANCANANTAQNAAPVVAADGTSLWAARTEDDALRVIDSASGEIVKTFEGIDVMRRLCLSPDGRTLLVTSHAAGEARIFAADAEEEIGRIALGEGVAPSGVTFGASAETAYVARFEFDSRTRLEKTDRFEKVRDRIESRRNFVYIERATE